MKRALYLIMISICFAGIIEAQNLDDAVRFNKRELTGTSRSLGMANAFGALGGDLSSLSINPAGIAVYRTSEFAFTPSISLNQSKASFGNLTDKDDKYAFPFNQIGGVSTYKPIREKDKGLISTHFGFTYNRTADFNENTSMLIGQGITDGNYNIDGQITGVRTLLSAIRNEAHGYYDNNGNFIPRDAKPDQLTGRAKWAYETYMLDPLFEDGTHYFSQYEDVIDYDDGTSTVYNRNVNGITQYNIIERDGYSGEYGFTFGANISHILLVGTSINLQSFRFEQTESFREVNVNSFDPSGPQDMDYFDAYNKLKQKGFGINAKLGVILNLHPLRIGASFHTPTFMDVSEEYYSGMRSYLVNFDSYNNRSAISEFEYNYRTPYRAQGSIAMVLGKFALLSVDYEMTDHTTSKFSSDTYQTLIKSLNNEINEQMKVTHDFRAGIEIKPTPFFALRAGAAYFDSPIKKEYLDTELTKWMATGGIGIRNINFFFDVAYAYRFNEDNYYLNTSDGAILEGLTFAEPVALEYRNHQASFTFGWKF
ncbi:MAG: outer membrane protein transport protein [Bacteroidales bacterium]|nr:outer membrane protein transport protein [Bacteroidales bacterium]